MLGEWNSERVDLEGRKRRRRQRGIRDRLTDSVGDQHEQAEAMNRDQRKPGTSRNRRTADTGSHQNPETSRNHQNPAETRD